MNIQMENLDAKQLRAIAAAYLQMLSPVMEACGSAAQIRQFDCVRRGVLSEAEFDCGELPGEAVGLATSGGQGGSAFAQDILEIAFLAAQARGKLPEDAFAALGDKLSAFISRMNQTIDSLEELVEQNLALLERLEKNKDKLRSYVRIERVEPGQAGQPGGKPTYAIHAELDRLFQEAAADIVRIVTEKGTVNKNAYIEQVVARVCRVLKEPAAIAAELEKAGMQTISGGEEPASGGSDERERDEAGANCGGPAKQKQTGGDLDQILRGLDREAYLELVGTLADGSAAFENERYRIDCLDASGGAGEERRVKIAADLGEGEPKREIVVGEKRLRDVLRQMRDGYKFTKTQKKKLDSIMETTNSINAEKINTKKNDNA